MFSKLFRKSRKPETVDTSSAGACAVPAASAKGKVLIVDDDAVVRKTLQIKLTAAGYRVSEASDGSTALALAGQENPDIIIMDIHLAPEPGMTWSGFSLMHWLNRTHSSVRSPFIVISGDDSAGTRDKALAAGAVRFFPKPLNMPALLAVLDTLIASDSRPAAV
jgi:DNA-binding response OmpR family regulator